MFYFGIYPDLPITYIGVGDLDHGRMLFYTERVADGAKQKHTWAEQITCIANGCGTVTRGHSNLQKVVLVLPSEFPATSAMLLGGIATTITNASQWQARIVIVSMADLMQYVGTKEVGAVTKAQNEGVGGGDFDISMSYWATKLAFHLDNDPENKKQLSFVKRLRKKEGIDNG